MHPKTQLPIRLVAGLRAQPAACRFVSSTPIRCATVSADVRAGRPPEPPTPEVANAYERIERRRRQANLLKDARDIRTAASSKSSGLKKRFWKDVDVKEVDGMFSWSSAATRVGSDTGRQIPSAS